MPPVIFVYFHSKSTFTWDEMMNELKLVQDFISVESLTLLFSHLVIYAHMNWGETKLKTVYMHFISDMIISVILTKMKFQTGTWFSCQQNLPKIKWITNKHRLLCLMCMSIWNSLQGMRDEFQIVHFDRNEISFCLGDKIWSCKHYLKWNVHIKISGCFEMQPKWNFICEQDLFSCQRNSK